MSFKETIVEAAKILAATFIVAGITASGYIWYEHEHHRAVEPRRLNIEICSKSTLMYMQITPGSDPVLLSDRATDITTGPIENPSGHHVTVTKGEEVEVVGFCTKETATVRYEYYEIKKDGRIFFGLRSSFAPLASRPSLNRQSGYAG